MESNQTRPRTSGGSTIPRLMAMMLMVQKEILKKLKIEMNMICHQSATMWEGERASEERPRQAGAAGGGGAVPKRSE